MERRRRTSTSIIVAKMLGDSGVGKTCLMNALLGHTFSPIQMATITPDFCSLKLTVNDQELFLEMWDTAGQSFHHPNVFLERRNRCFVLFGHRA
jgi:Ras-related protein Rab-7A